MRLDSVRTALGRTVRVGIFSLVLLALVMPAASAATTRLWVKRYDGPVNDVDEAVDLAFDSSGNVYVAGRSVGDGTHQDYVVIKYDPDGVQKWLRRWDGPGSGDDAARAIAVDGDGSVYVTGRATGSGSGNDFATIKYDASGTQKWVKMYHYGALGDEANAIAIDHLGNVIVTGSSATQGSSNDFVTIKYSPNGTAAWVKRYDGPAGESDVAEAVAVDSGNNVYVTGASMGDGTGLDVCTIKYGPGGTVQWVKRWNSSFNLTDGATDIVVDPEDYVYVAGYSHTTAANSDYITIRYAADGTKMWHRRYNGPAKALDTAWAIAYDYDRVYVTGYSQGSGTGLDYATVCYKRGGAQQWVKRYDGTAGTNDAAAAIAARNGMVYVTGWSNSIGPKGELVTIAYGAFGTFKWADRYNGSGNAFDTGNAVGVSPTTGNVYVTGGSYGEGTKADFVTIKYTP